MIEKGEIDQKAAELGVPPSYVQRDYVFGWLLAGLSDPSNPLRDRLILKGGNAFRKAYFPSARYSNDLDFSTQIDLDDQLLQKALVAACSFASSKSGVDFSVRAPLTQTRSMADGEARLHEGRVYFRSFYGEEELTIKAELDVAEFDTILLPIQMRQLIHDYSDHAECRASIRSWKLEELLAGKLRALLHRQHSPDLYDFVHAVFVQRALDVNRWEVVSTLLRKTTFEHAPEALRGLLLDLPFQALRSLWNEYLVCPREAHIEFDVAERNFRTIIPELFSLLVPQPVFAGASGRSLSHHVESGFRATIMEAGRLQRVLSIVYDGISRRVEPYALAFKRKKDGQAREYFYAFDLSGGRSGTQRIKSFFADELESVRATDESFEPRYPIELAKSGVGFFTSGTFAAPGSYGWRPSRSTRSQGSDLSYSVKCSYCGKVFKRRSLDTRLNDHKDKYGNKCFGRVGFIV
jgi:predicted nucleotidyltransferase component of viral defense system